MGSNADDITNCQAIEDPFCNIASKCTPCTQKFSSLTGCIVRNSGTDVIDRSIVDLVETCLPLTCDGSSDDVTIIDVVSEDEESKEEEDIVVVEEEEENENEEEDIAPDIPGTWVANGSFETLVAALSAADLVDDLSLPNGPYTVFAPTDDAFAALPAELVDCLLNDTPTLTQILLFHVAVGEVLSTQLTDGMKILTLLEEQEVVVDSSRNSVTINGATVTLPDVQTSNGVIHAINKVLVPPGVDVDAYLTTCTSSNEVIEEEEEEEDNEDENNDFGDDIDVGGIGDAIGDAIGSFLGEDVGNFIADAVNNFVDALFGYTNNVSGWFGGNDGGGGWFSQYSK